MIWVKNSTNSGAGLGSHIIYNMLMGLSLAITLLGLGQVQIYVAWSVLYVKFYFFFYVTLPMSLQPAVMMLA